MADAAISMINLFIYVEAFVVYELKWPEDDKQRRKAYNQLDKQRIPAFEMGADDTQRRCDGGARHDRKQTDGEDGVKQSPFHSNSSLKNNGDLQLYQALQMIFAVAKIHIFLVFQANYL
ncbi:MAG: hypothetical protein II433_07320 [Acidaminococcaceae bacterium]|nr:hypothetical protein [Acidaminococcaceae bacterium]